jgi:hypothetical protein
MISKFFIERPVLANVLAILMVVIGAVALMRLAVAQYPNVVPPTISVTTRYPGASARAVVDTVALPIEQQVNGVDGMIYMQSWSAADGTYTLIVTFKIGMDINFAQVLVQNRVSSALAQLPQPVQAQGVTVQQKSTAILQFVTLSSPDERYDSLFLANYATISLQPELARLPGVGQVNIFGAGQYSMRVWLDPNKLYARSLTTEDVVNALKGQNQQVTAGQLGMPPGPNTQAFQYTLDIAGRFDDVSQFENVVVKTEANGQMVHVRDVGRVELGAQTYSQIFTLNGKPAAGVGIFQTLEANALDVAGEVAKTCLQHTLRHHHVRARVHQGSVEDAVRGGDPGADRDRGVSAGLARHAGAHDHGARHHHRRICGHGGVRLHHQPVDPVRDRVGDRHRRRRRHRGRRRRRASHRTRPAGEGSGDPGHERAIRPDHRHHSGADVGVPAGRVHPGPHRQDVRAVRAGDRRHGAAQRHQCRHAQADPMRAMAAARRSAERAQFFLPRVQRRL